MVAFQDDVRQAKEIRFQQAESSDIEKIMSKAIFAQTVLDGWEAGAFVMVAWFIDLYEFFCPLLPSTPPQLHFSNHLCKSCAYI